VQSNAKSLKTLGKTKGLAFALAPFPLFSLSTANGFPARKWFPEILRKPWKMKQNQHFRVRKRLRCRPTVLIVHRKWFPCPQMVS